MAFLPIVSIPELETWIETWAFSEVIHSRSYTHIIRNVVTNPSLIFDDIVTNKYINKRAESVTQYYDNLIYLVNQYSVDKSSVSLSQIKKALYLAMMSVNILEGIRFYVSFACSFAFAERELMEGNAKIIKMIARDESLHLTGTQHILNIMQSGKDDPDFKIISQECKDECIKMCIDAANQEKEWAEYLFKDGSMIGLNKQILSQYVEYITNTRMLAVGLGQPFETKSNPIPWVNSWLSSDNVQVAPQETEISSYLVGQIDASVDDGEFDEFEL